MRCGYPSIEVSYNAPWMSLRVKSCAPHPKKKSGSSRATTEGEWNSRTTGTRDINLQSSALEKPNVTEDMLGL